MVRILLWLIDVAVNNADLLSHSYKCNVVDPQFWREIVTCLLWDMEMPKVSQDYLGLELLSVRQKADHVILTEKIRCQVYKNKTAKSF